MSFTGQHPDEVAVFDNLVLSSMDKTVFRAEPGYGAGTYSYITKFKFVLPSQAQVVYADAGSRYEAGDMLGVLAGTYTSILTLSALRGI